MTLSGHISATLITLKLFSNPAFIVVVNLLLHPILDMIPHAEWSTFRKSKTIIVIITFFDLLVSIFLLYLAFRYLFWSVWFIIIAILANLWLDILDPIFQKWWKKGRWFHEYLHTWPESPDSSVNWSKTITGKTALWAKIAMQLIFVTISILIVLRYWL